MHDAAEMLMLAVVDHLKIGMPKKWDFMDFWAEIKKNHPEPPQRIAMEQMNKMRVALKHNGTLPHGKQFAIFYRDWKSSSKKLPEATLTEPTSRNSA